MPWMVLAIATLKLTWLCGIERTTEEARLMSALTRIDLTYWFELAQEIIDDLPYWFY
ncbi:MAG: hypothetical protein HC866_19200 [Leptolyngbyaceae cyanobacterium RU_5_1]|nr:hypothetical protein [Leptolyngbyaceae cyanobacterium RU_5_1]